MLRSIPLRLKLVTALILPMLVVGWYLYVDISGSVADRDVAAAQRDEVDSFQAVSDLSTAIGDEQILFNSRDASAADLAAARVSTDIAYEALRGPDAQLTDERLQLIDGHYSTLLGLRATLGDEPTDARLRAASELRLGDGDTGVYSGSLNDLADLPLDVLSAFEFDPAAIDDAATAALIDDDFLVQRARADVRREASTLLRVATLPGNLVDSTVTESVSATIAETDESLEVLAQLASIDVSGEVDSMMTTPAWTRYESFRSAVDAGQAGERVEVDEAEFRAAAAEVDALLERQSDRIVSELEETASASVFDANRDVVVSGLIGLWLVIGVGILLRFLYRAIKRPLEQLTEQAGHVARVELPSVIDQMRRGEIEQTPEIELIPVEAKDEIGELVEAFNDMHRSAVDLAAGQAESRRVVADMFVNLGRRNQRLVGRLLNGLSTLEQHEQDPDKLAALYDLDHTATRMRRNAESLLVLAGAGQARRWDTPVPIHDVARAAIGEVENYQRVSIEVQGDDRIDGASVADVTHLLAELVENALSFSPPNSPVEIVAGQTSGGYVIAVSDHGIGMLPDQMDEANGRITLAAGEEESPSEFLGHYVVGRLAARHGIRVELSEGAAGGVTARVWIPAELLLGSTAGVTGPDDVTAENQRPMPAPAEAAIDQLPSVPMPAPSVIEPLPAHPSSPTGDPLLAPLGGTSPVDTALPDVPLTPLAPSSDSTDFLASLEAAGIQPRTSKVNDVVDIAASSPSMTPDPAVPDVAMPAVSDVASPAVSDVAPPNSTIETPATPEPKAASPVVVDASPTVPSLAELASMPSAPSVDPSPAPIVRPEVVPMAAPEPPRPSAVEPLSVAGAPADSPFGSPRRKPGANMPTTSLIESIAGSMGSILGDAPTASPVDAARATEGALSAVASHTGARAGATATVSVPTSAPAASTTPPSGNIAPPSIDPDRIRSALSSFQQGTARADEEAGA